MAIETINISKMITEFTDITKEFEKRLQNGDISSYVGLDNGKKNKKDVELLEISDIIHLRSFYTKFYYNGRIDAETYFSQEKLFLDKNGVNFTSYYRTIFYNIIVVQPMFINPHYSLKIFLDDVSNKDGFIFTHDEDSTITLQSLGENWGTSLELSTKQSDCTFSLFNTIKSYYSISAHLLGKDTAIEKIYYKPS